MGFFENYISPQKSLYTNKNHIKCASRSLDNCMTPLYVCCESICAIFVLKTVKISTILGSNLTQKKLKFSDAYFPHPLGTQI